LKIKESILGKDHKDIALLLDNFAELMEKTGRLPEAADLRNRARDIRSKL